MSTESLTAPTVVAVRLRLSGRVQGFGVRPTIARLANRLGVAGRVANTGDGVMIDVEGCASAVEMFGNELFAALPAGVVIDRATRETVPPRDFTTFTIDPTSADVSGDSAARVPPDRVVCEACLAEVRDAADRRRRYPFTGCSTCGPRYSIIEAMPYDRASTTMRRFSLCARCASEYRDPDDRRFHAQTNACPECGPRVRGVAASGETFVDDAAVRTAVATLRNGRIVALKGLGGYQLLVDAASTDAVRRLRRRKRRPSKPLAVLVGSLAQAERWARPTDAERRLLADPAGPIVVVCRRSEAKLAADVAPGFESIGLLLPTTPLHALLCEALDGPIVCTSGNLDGRPLVYREADAERELAGVADFWLHHDRAIVHPIDDAVVRIVAGAPCILRSGRGYAPLSLHLPDEALGAPILAVGGEQKAAVAVANGAQAALGPYVGDLSDAAVCRRWVEQLESLARLYGVAPDEAEIVHDRHPDYFSTRWAEGFRRRRGVQHHHAHVAAVLAEHGRWRGEVVGLAWDGAGYGDDGSIWGGECLRATTSAYRRLARLKPFSLVGGDLAVREPWRIATTLTAEALGRDAAETLEWPDVSRRQRRAVLDVAARGGLATRTSSMGRLFDAVAALALGTTTSDFEGAPALLLEECCAPAEADAGSAYAFAFDAASGDVDWRPVIAGVVADVRRGEPPAVAAIRFHRAVADLAVALAAPCDDLPLVCAGGVFQNAVLGELLDERLSTRRAAWLRPRLLPPGDGGLAAGQLAVAIAARFSAAEE